jgi:tetratricopeptide (TPR) repeat protein
MTPDDEIFRQFIAKALEIQAQKNDQALSTEEMQQVAASMGITTADLEAAFNAYWQRGSGFARLNNWDDAIAQLEQAVALKPDQPRVLYVLANAYRKRWELTQKRADYNVPHFLDSKLR